MTDKRMPMPTGMTAADYDRIADDLDDEAVRLRAIINRLDARVLAYRQTAEGLRETYRVIREHNDGLARPGR